MIKKTLLLFSFFVTNTISIYAQTINYSVPNKPWNEDFGNHRAEINVSQSAPAIYVKIPWRRRDKDAAQKCIFITDSNGKQMLNIYRINIGREFGELLFQPESGAGRYYVYYMPYKGKKNIGSFNGDYLKQETQPDDNWLSKNHLSSADISKKVPHASIIQIQSRTAFDSFFPMEVCATAAEVSTLLRKTKENYLLFPENRSFPIRMTNDLPQRWIMNNSKGVFKGKVKRNEYYVFQIGLFAAKKALRNIKVKYSDHSGQLTCFNLEGTDWNGKYFTKNMNVEEGKVQALWFGVNIPQDQLPGNYSFDVIVQPENDQPQTVKVNLQIENDILADRGDSEPWRHSRLRWLNSTLGIDDKVVAPYTPLKIKDKTINCLLRSIRLNEKGLIEEMISKKNSVLNRPLQFVVETETGIEKLEAKSFRFTKQNEGVAEWEAKAVGQNVALTINGKMEPDGHIDYSIHIKALKEVQLRDVRLEVPVKKTVAQYFMGMGSKGVYCPQSYDWKWKGPQDSYWIGTVNAGLHCEMRGATYSGPLLNLYHPKPPVSWYNENKGGFSIQSSDNEVIATTYSGERKLNVNEEIDYEFAMLITPVKELDTKDQFTTRYYHNGNQPEPAIEDLKSGIKVTNVHHANPINPYINYPFVAVDTMKKFVDKWHKNNLKVKIYYTIRELTNQTTEIWALRSLGTEILGDGGGGGYPWLREHFVDHYNVQWFNKINGYEACDAAVITGGQSRWYNYYIEGLSWLVKNVDIDGLYLDDVSFDRSMLKRMRKVMDDAKPGCLIDLHSNTGFSRGPATQYAEYFPFINKLWFGESFNYDQMPPENWMVEVSGIPFGLMGDMLHGGGNPWRGMVYGMTVRYPWFTEGVSCDPRSIWKIWDSFGIAESEMLGYWNPACPVKTSNDKVLATVYKKNNKTLIAIASWDKEVTSVKLMIDWKALGLNSINAKLVAPEIPNFQPAHIFGKQDSITVNPTKGWLIIVSDDPKS